MCKTCMDCAYGGAFNEKENCYTCKNEKIKTQTKEDVLFGNPFVVGNQAETCSEFMEKVYLEETDIEIETIVNLNFKCPYCESKDWDNNVSGEGAKFVKCYNCGRTYKIVWSLY